MDGDDRIRELVSRAIGEVPMDPGLADRVVTGASRRRGHPWVRELVVSTGLAVALIGGLAAAIMFGHHAGIRSSSSTPAAGISATGGWPAVRPTPNIPRLEPSPRSGAALAYDPVTRTTILFGGQTADDIIGDTWSWNGSGWTRLHPSASPPARAWAALAFDTGTGRLVLFGGTGPTARGGGDVCRCFGDTWTWDGTTWRRHTGAGPSARVMSGMAGDPATGGILLFGGDTGGKGTTFLADTWLWKKGVWTQSRAVGPSARDATAMASDPSAGSVVLFGGNGLPNGASADTWVWHVAHWSLIPGPGPPAMSGSMATSPAGVLLYGSDSSVPGPPRAETWSYTAGGWRLVVADPEQAASPSLPGPRADTSLAYDQLHRTVVLFGGAGNVGPLGGTWLFGDATWRQAAGAARS